MEKHLTEGELRAALDGELDAASLRHLESCAGCQDRQKQMETQKSAYRPSAWLPYPGRRAYPLLPCSLAPVLRKIFD